MPYIGGFPIYVQKCNEVMKSAYSGFVLKGARQSNVPPLYTLTKTVARAARHRRHFTCLRGGKASTNRLTGSDFQPLVAGFIITVFEVVKCSSALSRVFSRPIPLDFIPP